MLMKPLQFDQKSERSRKAITQRSRKVRGQEENVKLALLRKVRKSKIIHRNNI